MANASFSTGFRNALLNGITDMSTVFNSGKIDIYSGSIPADADATEGAGTILATVDLPASNCFAAAAASGAIAKLGTWTEASATNGGTAAWFRLYDSAGTTGASTTAVRIDGDVTATGGGGDIELTTVTISATDQVDIDTFSITINLNG